MRKEPQDSPSLAHREVDWAVGNSDAVAAQVGNNEEEPGWKPQIPDGWDCGYTYQYGKDPCPSMARGVPLPSTFGGHGGGGKYTQVLNHQAKGDYYRNLTGRERPQSTSEWVTWASVGGRAAEKGRIPEYTNENDNDIPEWRTGKQHSEELASALASAPAHSVCGGTLSGVSRAGKVRATTNQEFGGCGKRGRNTAIDEAMSRRGGERIFAPQRQGKEDHYHDPRVSSWYGPGMHNRDAHNPLPMRVKTDLQSEHGNTHLGGGKRGRNPQLERNISQSGGEMFMSPQAKPQMSKWGTQTGGGAYGRNQYRDAHQSSGDGRLW